MSPILAAANEEGLDRHRSAFAGEREHVGVAEAFRVHGLTALDIRQRAKPIAIDSGKLKILSLRRLGHQLRQTRLNAGRPSGEEFLRFAD